jgi:hypothetical protein
MPALDQRIEIDGADCYFEIKEVIPTAKTAMTRVGGASNAAGDDWNNDAANKFEAYPIERFGFGFRGRFSTHHTIADFLPRLSHGPKTIDGTLTIRLKVGTKLFMAAMGSDKVGATNTTKSYGNLTGKGDGFYDYASNPKDGPVTNLPKQMPVFAIKVTWMKESMSGSNPVILYFQNVLITEGGSGFSADGADVVTLPFQGTFITAVYNKDGY